MKKVTHLIIALGLVLLASLPGQSQITKPPTKFSLVEVPVIDRNQITDLITKGFDVDFKSSKKQNHVAIIAQPHDLKRLTNYGYKYNIVHDDITAFLKQRLSQPETKSLQIGQGSLGGYFNYTEALNFIDSLQQLHSNIMSVPIAIGQTHEGHNIMAYKISDNPGIDENEPRSLIT